MRFAIVLFVLLPLALGAPVEEKRFLLDSVQQLLGQAGQVGDVFTIAKQIFAAYGSDDNEAQCESTTCPQFLKISPVHIALVEELLCGSICKQVQVLAKHTQTGQ